MGVEGGGLIIGGHKLVLHCILHDVISYERMFYCVIISLL